MDVPDLDYYRAVASNATFSEDLSNLVSEMEDLISETQAYIDEVQEAIIELMHAVKGD